MGRPNELSEGSKGPAEVARKHAIGVKESVVCKQETLQGNLFNAAGRRGRIEEEEGALVEWRFMQ